jgi:hypothetical protein
MPMILFEVSKGMGAMEGEYATSLLARALASALANRDVAE